ARYSDDHVARLELIRDLQRHGLTLHAIRRLLDRAPESAAGTALAFVQAALSHAGRDDAEILDADIGAARLGVRATRRTADELAAAGIVEVLPDGRWRIVTPAAFSAAEELAALGVPAERRLAITHEIRAHADAMARAVTDLFVDCLWRPAVARAEQSDWVPL